MAGVLRSVRHFSGRQVTPTVLHRYRISLADVVAHFIGETGSYSVTVDQETVVVDIEQPADTTPEPPSAEAPQPAAAAAHSAESPKGGPIAQRAAILCAQGGFHAFLGVRTEGDAADLIRRDCGVISRAELDHNESAASRWQEIEGRYQLWLQGYD